MTKYNILAIIVILRDNETGKCIQTGAELDPDDLTVSRIASNVTVKPRIRFRTPSKDDNVSESTK